MVVGLCPSQEALFQRTLIHQIKLYDVTQYYYTYKYKVVSSLFARIIARPNSMLN